MEAEQWHETGESLVGAVQKRMRSVVPETEEAASLAYDLKAPVVSSIINERSQNKWGIPQGYRIQVHSHSGLTSGPLQVLMADCCARVMGR